jgi:protein-S-isoprenylcysteine O-methyltransferase Ste14
MTCERMSGVSLGPLPHSSRGCGILPRMPDSHAAKPAAIAGFALAVLGIALLYLRGAIFAREWPLMAVQAAAVALMLWARLTFGLRSFNLGAAPTQGDLVTSGPYRFWRHPIYAAVIIFVSAAAASHPGWITFALAALVAGGLFLRMRSEEQFLMEKYPGYRAYIAKTARVVPGVFALLIAIGRG